LELVGSGSKMNNYGSDRIWQIILDSIGSGSATLELRSSCYSNQVHVKARQARYEGGVHTNDLCEEALGEPGVEVESVGGAHGALIQTFPHQLPCNQLINNSESFNFPTTSLKSSNPKIK